HRHVRELELDRLVLRDGRAKRPPLFRVPERGVETSLPHPHRERRDRDATARQRVQELPVTATAWPEHALARHLAVIEAQRVRVRGVPAQLSIWLEHVVTGSAAR